MLDRLPDELKLRLINSNDFGLSFHREKVAYINRSFYVLANELYRERISKMIDLSLLDHNLVSKYIDGIDFWIGPLSDLVKPNLNYHFIHILLMDRRIYFDEKDVSISSTSNQVINDYEILNGNLCLKEVNSLQYKKSLKLPKGFSYKWSLYLIRHQGSKGVHRAYFTIKNRSSTSNIPYSLNHMVHSECFTNVPLERFELGEDEDNSIEIAMRLNQSCTKVDFLYFQFSTYASPIKGNWQWLSYVPRYKENIFERLVYMNLQGLYHTNNSIEIADISFEAFYTSGSRKHKIVVYDTKNSDEYTRERILWRNPFV